MGVEPPPPITMKSLAAGEQEFRKKMLEAKREYGEILLCTDFDGTLVPFTEVPDRTRLPKNVRNLLIDLTNLEGLHLAIISGREFQELSNLIQVENATLAGNHGLKLRFEDGSIREPELGEDIYRTVSDLKRDIKERFAGKDGIFIEDKSFGLALHYRQYEGDEGEVEEDFHRIWKTHAIRALEVLKGAKLLEVRPSNWNKGDAVRILQERWGRIPTIYIGDDTTDEDAFRLLRDQELGFPILVNPVEDGRSHAQYRVKNPEGVKGLLEEVYELFPD